MQRKLTITIDEDLYQKLYQRVGTRRISRFISDTIAPLLRQKDPLLDGYRKMATDELANKDALEWIENLVGEGLSDDSGEDWAGWR